MGDYDTVSHREKIGPSINMDIYLRPGGAGGRLDGKPFCCAAHPSRGDVWCRRQPGHEDRDTDGHAAFVHSIREPEYWES